MILIIKPTRCTNFSSVFLEYDSTCFKQFLCPSSGVEHCKHSNRHNLYVKYLWLCVQWQSSGDGQRNCPKHGMSYSKNTFEKVVDLGGFITRIYHDARSSECQKSNLILSQADVFKTFNTVYFLIILQVNFILSALTGFNFMCKVRGLRINMRFPHSQQ